ncbi:GATA transcription factor 18-like [Telopea speciosissima]|uniref:GATA transcription factor 18-like n=1 Tax=Telopea speciosissima TaxID=54955 RepID=UPI001CC82E01|nr:GATA transcription factor 18-like [Telopea speciosissima]
MHRCNSSRSSNTTMAQCSCGLFHTQENCFSYTIPSPSSSVDCTLSLGTPSTRQTKDKSMANHRRSGSYMSNLCWDIFQTKKSHSSTSTSHKNSHSSSGNSGSILNNLNGDPLFARRCANCDTTSTPLWRNGPRGPKSLCNACGIRYKKEERRATTTATNTGGAGMMESQYYGQHHPHQSWGHGQKMDSMSPATMGNEFRFIEDEDQDSSTTGIPFLSWRLNNRPSLVHDWN